MKISNLISAILLGVCGFSFSYCNKPTYPVTGVRLKFTAPIGDTRRYDTMVFTNDVYHSGSLTQYRIAVNLISITHEIGLPDSEEKVYEYFVFDKDSTYGIDFIPNGKTVPTDSGFVKKEDSIRFSVDSARVRSNYNSFLLTKDWKRVPDSSFWFSKNKFINVYELKKTKESPENISYHYWYSDEFKDVAESFSKNADTVNGLKLFKLILHMHGAYYEKKQQSTSEREFIYEMQRPSLEELKTADGYFNRYRNLQDKNKLQHHKD